MMRRLPLMLGDVMAGSFNQRMVGGPQQRGDGIYQQRSIWVKHSLHTNPRVKLKMAGNRVETPGIHYPIVVDLPVMGKPDQPDGRDQCACDSHSQAVADHHGFARVSD
jgi:hypothetical protein